MVRHKNRYMVIEINEVGKTDKASLVLKTQSLHHSIQAKVHQLHGDFGEAAIRAGFTAKYCNPHTRIAIIRTRHGPHKLVTSSLPFIREIESKNVNVNMLYVGATMKQCFKYIKNYQQQKFDEFSASLKTNEEKIALKDALLNFETLLINLGNI